VAFRYTLQWKVDLQDSRIRNNMKVQVIVLQADSFVSQKGQRYFTALLEMTIPGQEKAIVVKSFVDRDFEQEKGKQMTGEITIGPDRTMNLSARLRLDAPEV